MSYSMLAEILFWFFMMLDQRPGGGAHIAHFPSFEACVALRTEIIGRMQERGELPRLLVSECSRHPVAAPAPSPEPQER